MIVPSFLKAGFNLLKVSILMSGLGHSSWLITTDLLALRCGPQVRSVLKPSFLGIFAQDDFDKQIHIAQTGYLIFFRNIFRRNTHGWVALPVET